MKKMIEEFNELNIKDLPEITELFELKGEFVNMEYTLLNGEKVKLLDDNKTYYGCQVEKEGLERCYGLVADENYLLVCEYGLNGAEPEIIVYKKR